MLNAGMQLHPAHAVKPAPVRGPSKQSHCCIKLLGLTRPCFRCHGCKPRFNTEKRGKRQVLLRPASKVVIKFLQLMQKHGYIGEFEKVDDHRAGKIVVELNGRLNKCGVMSPRYDVSSSEIEDWIGRLLPSRQFGVIVLTTSAGIMDHEEARRKKLGGKVLGFFY